MRQLDLIFNSAPQPAQPDGLEWLSVGGRKIRLVLARHRRARRYVLRLRGDGAARVTIPRGGSAAEAKRFAERNVPWLEKQLLRRAAVPPLASAWVADTEILLRGQLVRLETSLNGAGVLLRFGAHELQVRDPAADLRPEVELYLWNLAWRELPARVMALAALHQLPVRRVSVRNQRSRWGSCSRRGTICLNWRLVQAPDFVCDYIILHELAHLKEMNHSRRFWKHVAQMCPDHKLAEAWLRKNSRLLR